MNERKEREREKRDAKWIRKRDGDKRNERRCGRKGRKKEAEEDTRESERARERKRDAKVPIFRVGVCFYRIMVNPHRCMAYQH